VDISPKPLQSRMYLKLMKKVEKYREKERQKGTNLDEWMED
jgi:hypothetical protein